MSILEFKMDFAGQASVNPRLGRMVSTDNLATVTSQNYVLSEVNSQGLALLPTDFIAVAYSGGEAWFNPSIDSQGNITLVSMDNPGGVTVSGAVTVGHVATFAGATSIQDGGALGTAAFKAVSDNTKASVASINATPVPIGNVPTFSAVSGTIQDGGVALSALQRSANIKAGQRSFAGGATTFDIGDAAFTSSSIAVASFISQSNPASIVTIVPSVSNLQLTFSADPGASVISFVAFAAAQ